MHMALLSFEPDCLGWGQTLERCITTSSGKFLGSQYSLKAASTYAFLTYTDPDLRSFEQQCSTCPHRQGSGREEARGKKGIKE